MSSAARSAALASSFPTDASADTATAGAGAEKSATHSSRMIFVLILD